MVWSVLWTACLGLSVVFSIMATDMIIKRAALCLRCTLGPLPAWGALLAERFAGEGITDEVCDQMIVNEYLPGQGIASHVDCVPCFGNSILSLSLGSAVEMVFSNVSSKQQVPLLVEPGSLLVMQGEARFNWQHGIPARKSDLIGGQRKLRSRRISLTFRHIILQGA